MSSFIGKLKSLSRRRILYAVLAVGVIAALGLAVKNFRYHFVPHDVSVVEPGGIVRGARQTPFMLRKIIQDYHIRTIINLDDKVLERRNKNRPDADPYVREKAIARDLGVQYHGFVWQGSGIGPYPEYDAVADILATTSSRPVFLHCAAGEKRTNAALVAYWIRYRGYTLERAIEGLMPYGFTPSRRPELIEHLRGYFEYTKRTPQPGPPTKTPEKKK